jgi:signal transduction histidine kinase
VYGHYIFGYMAYLSFFWFAYSYPNKSKFSVAWPIALSISTISLLSFIPLGHYFLAEIRPGIDIAERIVFNTPGYVGFIVMLSSVFFLGLILLVLKLRAVKKTERYQDLDRNQIYFAILTFLAAGTSGIVFNLIFPLFGNFSLFYINPMLVTIALIGLGFYNLNKYRIFNAKVVLAEFFTAGIWIISIARLALSNSTAERLSNALLLLATIAFGIFLIRNITKEIEQKEEIQRLADNLKRANEKLKELDKMKSQFLSIASHDLRTPLSVIRNYLSLAFEGAYGKVPAAMQEGLQQVFERATDMAKSIDTYLNVSRIEQGKMKYDFIDVELAPILEKAVSDFNLHAKEKGLDFTSSIASELQGKKAKLDVSKINEVLNNLIDNSIKYTPKGSINLSAVREGNIARVVVKDTGIGMSQETAGKLFKLFSTGDNSLKINISSTGVGLYITRAHVEAHKGRIWAESEGEGKGSSFILELPLLE